MWVRKENYTQSQTLQLNAITNEKSFIKSKGKVFRTKKYRVELNEIL